MKKLELIEKYLSEELSATELKEFEHLQQIDTDFAEEVEMAVAVNAHFNVQQKLRWQSLVPQQTEKRDTPVRQLQPKTRSLNWIRSIAAVSILGLGLALGWMFFSGNDLNEMVADQVANIHTPPSGWATGNVGMSNEDVNWDNARKAYSEGNFSIAVAAIEKSIEKNTDKLDEKYFYLGLSYMYEDVPNYDKAITLLNKSKALNASNQNAVRVNWYMSLAHLENENKETAKALLQQVVNDGSWKKAEATALLNNL